MPKLYFSIAGLKNKYRIYSPTTIISPNTKKIIRLSLLAKLSPTIIVLHATLVSNKKNGIAIVGASGTGKSTLARTLFHKGYTSYANDFIAVWKKGDSVYGGDINYHSINKTRPAIKITKIIFLNPKDCRDVYRATKSELINIYAQTVPEISQAIIFSNSKSNIFSRIYRLHICLGNRSTPHKWHNHLQKVISYRPPCSIGIIGLGTIGQDVSNLLLNEKWLCKLNLFSTNYNKLKSIILDLKSANPSLNILLHQSASLVMKSSDVVIICFNLTTDDHLAPKVNERFTKTLIHSQIIKSLFTPNIAKNFNGTILVVTNPIDILSSHLLRELSPSISSHQVFGVGLGLDYNRLRTFNHHLDVVGEHGDSLILVNRKSDLLSVSNKNHLRTNLIEYSAEIRKYTPRTRFGPAHEIISILRTLAGNSRRILRVSTLYKECFLGRHLTFLNGVPQVIYSTTPSLDKRLTAISKHHTAITDKIP